MRRLPFLNVFLAVLFLAISVQGQNTNCPKISVSGPAGLIVPGDDIVFSAVVSANRMGVRYEWTVQGAKIVDGQGTAQIKVSGAEPGSTVKADVKVSEVLTGCEDSESGTVEVFQRIGCMMPFDQWENLKPNDVRGRFDVFFLDLMNNPESTGVIILHTVGSERRDSENPRIKFFVKHANFRKFDLNRIVILFEHERAESARTVLHRVPPSAELPCSDCTRVNGNDLK
jgi:hypothetical protein